MHTYHNIQPGHSPLPRHDPRPKNSIKDTIIIFQLKGMKGKAKIKTLIKAKKNVNVVETDQRLSPKSKMNLLSCKEILEHKKFI